MNSERRWDQRDLTELLTLEPAGQQNWRSYAYDTNTNGRVYSGQLLGQAVWAAAQTANGRAPSMLHMTFLQGARPKETIEYSVEALQDGRCFSTRHIYGVQGTGMVLSANASFQVAQPEPENPHPLQQAMPAPEGLPSLAEWAEDHLQDSEALQLSLDAQPLLDIRPIHPHNPVERPADQLESAYWVRVNPPLATEGCLHAAALAYLSDGWLNAGIAPAPDSLDQWRNLNHTLWFHSQEIDVNQWLLFVNTAVRSLYGRELTMTHIYRRDGRVVASMAQDLLISAGDA